MEVLVPYHLVFCHKKQENLCVFVSLCEAIWVAGIARVSCKWWIYMMGIIRERIKVCC